MIAMSNSGRGRMMAEALLEDDWLMVNLNKSSKKKGPRDFEVSYRVALL